ncbi:hypothetical protein V6N13_099372 [Hibiscus sabdariffa]|uniref:Uncharacterized protein n=1 Tax=Hibiscus sabdariffa TaxID=183260 RepID=A0ABR2PZJ8_9ROSI
MEPGEDVSEENESKENINNVVYDQGAEYVLEKTSISKAGTGVVTGASISTMLDVGNVVKDSEGTIEPKFVGDMVHVLQKDCLEETRCLNLRVFDCSESATYGPQ